MKQSKRAWDGRVRQWRVLLHKFDDLQPRDTCIASTTTVPLTESHVVEKDVCCEDKKEVENRVDNAPALPFDFDDDDIDDLL